IRYLVFTGFAVLLIGPGRVRTVFRSARPLLQGGRGLLQLVEAAVFVLAFAYLPLADVHAIAAASPLIVVALSAPLLGERVAPAQWLAVAAGFSGVLLILRPGFQTVEWPLLLPVAGAFLWGYYQILVRQCAGFDSSETTLLWSALVGLVAVSSVAPLQWRTPDLMALALLVAIGLLGSAAHLALIKALAFAQAAAIQPFTYTLLLWVTILGYLVFGDLPDVWTVAGALVVLGSGLFSWHREWRAAQDGV
ncbi:MAG TPA: DMT family transporter, partial [Woeseiaceae bacterium]|nr:DMT family transporter [Woeseiaceae bacterium]